MYFPRGGEYRYWIRPYRSTTLPVVTVRKLNPMINPPNSPEIGEIVIGDESVGTIIKRKLDVIDARQRSELNDPDRCLIKQSEVAYYTDIGYADGLPYQGDATIIIFIPFTRLKWLATKLHDISVNTLGISKSIRDIVLGNYLQSYAEKGILDIDSIATTNNWTDDETASAQTYLEFIDSCYQQAEERIQSMVKKYMALGTYPIIRYKDA